MPNDNVVKLKQRSPASMLEERLINTLNEFVVEHDVSYFEVLGILETIKLEIDSSRREG